MAISRRLFIKASGGSLATVAISGVLAAKWFSGKEDAKKLVRSSLSKRFPHLDLDTQGVREFEAWFVGRADNELGVSGASMSMALDEKVQPLDFDRFLYREFALNTNYFSHKSAEFMGIEFIPMS